MTRLIPIPPPINRIIRPTVLALSLSMVACSLLQQPAQPGASTDLRGALELYRSGDAQSAEPILKAIYSEATTSISDQRRALAAAILIQLKYNTSASLDEAQALIDRYAQLNAGPIEPEFYLLRESLSSALAARRESQSQHSALTSARRKLDTAQSERQQLEDTLRKLRKLSLE